MGVWPIWCAMFHNKVKIHSTGTAPNCCFNCPIATFHLTEVTSPDLMEVMRIHSLLISALAGVFLAAAPIQNPCTDGTCSCLPDYKIGEGGADPNDPNGPETMNEPNGDQGVGVVTITGDPGDTDGGKAGQKKGTCRTVFGTCSDCTAKSCRWRYTLSFSLSGLMLPDDAELSWGMETETGYITDDMDYNPITDTASGASADYIEQHYACGVGYVEKDIAVARTDVDPPVVLFRLKLSFKCNICPNTPQ